jgi:hypothetical protein
MRPQKPLSPIYLKATCPKRAPLYIILPQNTLYFNTFAKIRPKIWKKLFTKYNNIFCVWGVVLGERKQPREKYGVV